MNFLRWANIVVNFLKRFDKIQIENYLESTFRLVFQLTDLVTVESPKLPGQDEAACGSLNFVVHLFGLIQAVASHVLPPFRSREVHVPFIGPRSLYVHSGTRLSRTGL